MKNKNGFTLIELLAVIVILAVVILIALTTVLPRLEESRKDAFATETAKFVQGAVSNYASVLIGAADNELTTSGGKMPLESLVTKGYIQKGDIENYTGCISVNPKAKDAVEYQIAISNGKFKYVGDATNINKDNIEKTSEEANCEDIENISLGGSGENNGANSGNVDEGSNNNTENDGDSENIVVDGPTLSRTLLYHAIFSYHSFGWIDNIQFVRYKPESANTIDCNNEDDYMWCVAEEDAEKGITSDAIVAWLEEIDDNEDEGVIYTLYVGSDQTIFAPQNSYKLLNWRYINSMTFDNFNTSRVENMQEMFVMAYSLTELDLSGFDTSRVTNMKNMFKGCTGLEKLNISNFEIGDETVVTGMFDMGKQVSSLREIHLNSAPARAKLEAIIPNGVQFIYN